MEEVNNSPPSLVGIGEESRPAMAVASKPVAFPGPHWEDVADYSDPRGGPWQARRAKEG